VGDYSARQLTVSTDKAIAIAGVASIVHQNTRLTYAAGLWKELLLFNLLWLPAGDPVPRPVHRAPTWSWISVDGKVTHQLPDGWQTMEPLVSGESLDQAEMVGDLVHNATLRLTGQVRPLELDNMQFTYDIKDSFRLDELRLLPVVIFKSAGSTPGASCCASGGRLSRGTSVWDTFAARIRWLWTGCERPDRMLIFRSCDGWMLGVSKPEGAAKEQTGSMRVGCNIASPWSSAPARPTDVELS
ncbi:hypothetical protein C8A05DRAFT_19975, partial [Staphylotrichum tortipilum]